MKSLIVSFIVLFSPAAEVGADNPEATGSPSLEQANPEDRALSRAIWEALLGDQSLSFPAQNLKIEVRNGIVTVQGPVDNEREKKEILEVIRELAGRDNVVERIEVLITEPT